MLSFVYFLCTSSCETKSSVDGEIDFGEFCALMASNTGRSAFAELTEKVRVRCTLSSNDERCVSLDKRQQKLTFSFLGLCAPCARRYIRGLYSGRSTTMNRLTKLCSGVVLVILALLLVVELALAS